MKLLLSLSCNIPDFSGASVATLDLNQAMAKQLLGLHADVRAFLAEKATDSGLSTHFNPSFGWGGLSPLAFSNDYSVVDEMAERIGDKEFVIIPDDHSFKAESNDDSAFLTECNRVEFSEGCVRFTFLAKHGNEAYSAGWIPLDVLRMAAA